MKRFLGTFLVFWFVFPPAFSQVVTKRMSDRMHNRLPKEKLDRADYRCVYAFTQKATERQSGKEVALTDTMALDMGPVYSVYYDRNKAFRDSVYKVKWEETTSRVKCFIADFSGDMSSYKDKEGEYAVASNKGERSRIYKNRKKNQIITIDGDNWGRFKNTENLKPPSWEFISDTLSILGYVCQKAVTTFRGRKYEAWFTPEIPINDGPWKLYGLPGLILKASADNGLFLFEAIGLEYPDKKERITLDKDSYVNCTWEQLAQKRRKEKKTLAAHYYFNGNYVAGEVPNPLLFQELELK